MASEFEFNSWNVDRRFASRTVFSFPRKRCPTYWSKLRSFAEQDEKVQSQTQTLQIPLKITSNNRIPGTIPQHTATTKP